MNQISTRIEHLKGPVCIMGLSGIGKTHLATSFPELVFDTDRALDKATESEWPHLSAYDRRRAWRVFCSKKPWDEEKENLSKWSAIRKKYVSLLGDYFEREEDCLILTSEFNFPHRIDLYVGVDIGRYETHLEVVGKVADNGQCESMNNRLEGYIPLVRITPGTHLSDAEPIQEWLRSRI